MGSGILDHCRHLILYKTLFPSEKIDRCARVKLFRAKNGTKQQNCYGAIFGPH